MSDTDTGAPGPEPAEPAGTTVAPTTNGDDGRDPASGRVKAKRSARPSFWHRLYHGETTYDFVGKRRIGYAISGVLILISLLSLFTRGLNLGLDFEGGVSWEVPAKNGLTTNTADDILGANGINANDAKVQTLSGTDGQRLRIQVGDQPSDVQNNVRTQLAQKAGVDVQEVSLRTVSPTWGNEITHKAERALVFFFIAIALYISIRFEWKMAVGAIAAVVHDVFISVGIYSVFGFEVTPETVIAFLTILGFSLYDTIVVFDKVHENTKRLTGGRATYGDIVNLSMNQTLMRSLNTSLAAVLPVLALLLIGSELLGAIALQDFALALLIGLITGSYSSIFIATPILAVLKEREPRYRQLRERLGRGNTANLAALRAGAAPPTGRAAAAAGTPAAATAGAGSGPGAAGAGGGDAGTRSGATAIPRPAGGFNHPPRPRKKKRR